MNKRKLPAALVAAFAGLAATAGVAQAETSVTLYGIVDVGIGYQQVKGNGVDISRTGLIDGVQSGSRWGLRGSEDLGNGTRAIFQLESGFNPRTGRSSQGGRLFGRQATVGLANDAWGQLTMGRQTNITSQFFSSIDPFAASFGQANIGSVFSSANTLRYDNLIQYLTPSFGGFQAGIGYSFDIGEDSAVGDLDSDANTWETGNKTRAITGGIRYAAGPLNLAAAADYLNPPNNTTGGKGPTRTFSWLVGGSYDFEVVKLALAYGQTEDGWFGSPGLQSGQSFSLGGTGIGNYTGLANGKDVNKFEAKSYLVGLSAPIGPGSLFGSWQRADPKNDNLTGDDATMNIYSLGYTYDMSKRTNLYAYGSYAKNWAFLDDVKSTVVGVGLRHRF